MPSQYPPYSSARHAAIDARRSSRGPSRERPSSGGRDGPYRQQQQQQVYSQQPQQTYVQQSYVERQDEGKGKKMKTLRGHLNAMLGEFIGTTMFLWIALAGTQSAATLTAGQPNGDISVCSVINNLRFDGD